MRSLVTSKLDCGLWCDWHGEKLGTSDLDPDPRNETSHLKLIMVPGPDFLGRRALRRLFLILLEGRKVVLDTLTVPERPLGFQGLT